VNLVVGGSDKRGLKMSEVDLIYGALLHDIGKVYYRGTSQKGDHSTLGWENIKKFENFSKNDTMKECILYHHSDALKGAKISPRSLAYIVYEADNISSGMDRRNIDSDDKANIWKMKTPMSSIFNILNEEKEEIKDIQKNSTKVDTKNETSYHGEETSSDKNICDIMSFTFPFSYDKELNFADKNNNEYTQGDYDGLIHKMNAELKAMKIDEKNINSLLELLNNLWSFVPSCTDTKQLVDISLFDHVKTTAAISVCILEYLKENKIYDYKKEIKTNYKEFRKKDIFFMATIELSGIENFVYNISGSEALKSLRARSFYIEVLLEHIVDTLLERLALSRVNLLYNGGGSATLLLPRTKNTEVILKDIKKELKSWFIENFGVDLKINLATTICNSNDLMNKKSDDKSSDDKKGSEEYKAIFNRLSTNLYKEKNRYFEVDDIKRLNQISKEGTRECRECKRSDILVEDEDICPFCYNLIQTSNDLKHKEMFVVSDNGVLDLPFGKKLSFETKEDLKKEISLGNNNRIYTKNNPYIGDNISCNLHLADYDYSDFETIMEENIGFNRLGVLNIDVNDFRENFINGFPKKYLSISRTTNLSRYFDKFFKYYINQMMIKESYKVRVIYSGGDDLFIIGAWLDILRFLIDFDEEFKKFTTGKMTFCAGVGLFKMKFPVSRMYQETDKLLKEAKEKRKEKKINGSTICLFSKENILDIDTFINNIFYDKLEIIKKSFDRQSETGKAFIYKLLELLRNKNQINKNQLNISRLAYLLARIKEANELDQDFVDKLYEWSIDDNESKNLILALEIYVLETREN
jgi:CRISPR-associated protein Csm1